LSNRTLKRRYQSSRSPQSRSHPSASCNVPISHITGPEISHQRNVKPVPRIGGSSRRNIRPTGGPAARIEKTNFTRPKSASKVAVPAAMHVDEPPIPDSSVQIDGDHALALQIQDEEARMANQRRQLSRRRSAPSRVGHQNANRTPIARRVSNRRRPATSINDLVAISGRETGANTTHNNPDQGMDVDFDQGNEASSQGTFPLVETIQIQEDENLARQLQASDYLNEEDSRPRPVDRLEHQAQHMFPGRLDSMDPFLSHFSGINELGIGRSPWMRPNFPPTFHFQMPNHGDMGDDFFRNSAFTRMLSADRVHPGIRNFSNPFTHPFFSHNSGISSGIDAYPEIYIPRRRNRGANQRTINELPTRQFVVPEQKNSEDSKTDDAPGTKDNQKSCCICMENFKDAENVRTLPCLHIFHTSCIDSWLVRSSTCPICKLDINTNNVPNS